MGNDGGTKPTRRDLCAKAKQYVATAAELTRGVTREETWRSCCLSTAPLKDPVVCCRIGNLYNLKTLKRYLRKGKMPETLSHIQSKADVIRCRIHFASGFGIPKGSFVCPFSPEKVAKGRRAFYCSFGCGCIFSKEALKIAGGKLCPGCETKIKKIDLVPLFGSPQEQDELRKRFAVLMPNTNPSAGLKVGKSSRKCLTNVDVMIKSASKRLEATNASLKDVKQ